ncbi:hypothetical protein EDB87DRAFT_807484 [Lactarius vividus]|nr:hypothetical protein EDB87DRAFT_807484 [Lactarius vividus]
MLLPSVVRARRNVSSSLGACKTGTRISDLVSRLDLWCVRLSFLRELPLDPHPCLRFVSALGYPTPRCALCPSTSGYGISRGIFLSADNVPLLFIHLVLMSRARLPMCDGFLHSFRVLRLCVISVSHLISTLSPICQLYHNPLTSRNRWLFSSSISTWSFCQFPTASSFGVGILMFSIPIVGLGRNPNAIRPWKQGCPYLVPHRRSEPNSGTSGASFPPCLVPRQDMDETPGPNSPVRRLLSPFPQLWDTRAPTCDTICRKPPTVS